MEINIDAITAFLSGSLITLIFKELINQYNKKQDFNREINKIVYVRKLETGEKAIAFYNVYVNRVISMTKSIEIIAKAFKDLENSSYDLTLIKEIIDQNGKALTDLESNDFIDISAVHLYFNLKDEEKWSAIDLQSMYSIMSEIKATDTELQFYLNHYNINKDTNPALATHYWQECINNLPKYTDKLRELISLLEKNKVASENIIVNIKEQINIK